MDELVEAARRKRVGDLDATELVVYRVKHPVTKLSHGIVGSSFAWPIVNPVRAPSPADLD
jgi:hypothetical protein